jgi:5-(carboxyamino)imidazole ribonucleotide synthase
MVILVMDENMNKFPLSHIGIIGGGQLARMIITENKLAGFDFTILDPSDPAPASSIADRHIVAKLTNEAGLRELVQSCDITTYEIEHTNVAFLKQLVAEGHKIYPSPDLLGIIQDKYLQKQTLKKLGIPTTEFKNIENPTVEAALEFGLPLVQKSRKEGYDGRGVQVINSRDDLHKLMPVVSVFEKKAVIQKELSALVARNIAGEIACFPIVEMHFDERANMLDMLLAPARVSHDVAERARALAIRTVEALDGVGIFAVELFWTDNDQLLVNEIAPRPHNSGHFTIEACATSQFQQHIRAICNLPLGSTEQYRPAVMINLNGELGHYGTPKIIGAKYIFDTPAATLHFYGKTETRPFRKMGHVTILADTIDEALDKALKIKKNVKIITEETE